MKTKTMKCLTLRDEGEGRESQGTELVRPMLEGGFRSILEGGKEAGSGRLGSADGVQLTGRLPRGSTKFRGFVY